MATRPQVIALEEHYLDPEVKPYITGSDVTRQPKVSARLDDVGQGRIAEMDAAGIDIQVLSHGAPSVQRLEAELAVRLARGANDRLAETVRAHPDRFAAFAMLPTADPKAAADELGRAAHKLAETMYAKASQPGGAEHRPGGDGAAPGEGPASGPKDDAVDADFEEVKG